MRKSNGLLIIVLILFLGIIIGGVTFDFKSYDERMLDFEEEITQPNDLNPLQKNSIESESFFSQLATGIGEFIENVIDLVVSFFQKIVSGIFLYFN